MTRAADEEARARRAEARRRTWGAIERVPSGTDKPPLHDALTMEERLVRVWQLSGGRRRRPRAVEVASDADHAQNTRADHEPRA